VTTTALVRAELGRLTATPLARLAFIALMVVPLLYGGAYLWANQNPYAKLDHVPAALVVNDVGATQNGKHVNYGTQVADRAVADAALDWHEVSAAQASKGVRTGEYDFVFTIPSNFSSSLVSASGSDPRRAEIVMTTDDANSYLSSTIAQSAATSMRTAVAENVGKKAAKQLLVGLADIRQDLIQASDASGQLASGASKAASGASSLASGTAQLSTGASTLASGASTLSSGASTLASGASSLDAGLSTLQSSTAQLPAETEALSVGAGKVAAGNKRLADTADGYVDTLNAVTAATSPEQLLATLGAAGVTLTPAQQQAVTAALSSSDVQKQLATAVAQANTLDGQLDQLRDGSAQVAAGASSLASAAPTLTNGIASASAGASKVSSGASSVASGAASVSSGAASLASGASTAASGASTLSSGVSTLSSGTAKLHDGLASGVSQIPASSASSREDQASVVSDPVTVSNDNLASAGGYGAGLAPFFISLAAWIGMYALFLILKPISKRAITAVRRPFSVTLGAWLTPAVLGLTQMLALFAIVKFALGFDVAWPAATIGIMVLASVTFAAIIMALNVLLGSVGQFLGLVLMLIQLVTAGGTFPWQTLPAPLAALHHALPMSYSVDALRQLMYGGSVGAAWTDAGVLACWLAGALLVTFVVAARQSRTRTLRDLRPSLIG
jgi:putative membrane protein